MVLFDIKTLNFIIVRDENKRHALTLQLSKSLFQNFVCKQFCTNTNMIVVCEKMFANKIPFSNTIYEHKRTSLQTAVCKRRSLTSVASSIQYIQIQINGKKVTPRSSVCLMLISIRQYGAVNTYTCTRKH